MEQSEAIGRLATIARGSLEDFVTIGEDGMPRPDSSLIASR
jgi:hypothetical protein